VGGGRGRSDQRARAAPMTTITKIGIQGIRSFDHETMEIIEFERPVTLIVGPNGSGKTTIIECLKMASAGLLPPGARNGHGFVHDPQVARLPEVKGQIKMLFRTGGAADREVCATRSFQLTNKRVGGRLRPQYKALESVLKTHKDDGGYASVSHRCVDMDQQVPELMGVTRAILESVIFCHQEDSCWPLQDAAAVKKRFDDIFGATRYTKALENIKVLQREWTKTMRDRRAEADLSQAHMDQATKLASQKDEREKVVEEIATKLRDLDAQVGKSSESIQQAEMQLVKYESGGTRVAELRSLIARCEEERREVTRDMEERQQDIYRESLEELKSQAQHFAEVVMVQSAQKVQQAKKAHAEGEGLYRAAVDAARKLREEMGDTLAAAELISSRKAELAGRLQQVGEPSVAALRARVDAAHGELQRSERDLQQRGAAAEAELSEAERVLGKAKQDAFCNEARAGDAQGIIRHLEEEAKTLVDAVPNLDALMRCMRENEAALGADGSDSRQRRLEARQEEIGRRRHDLQYSIQRKSGEVAQIEAQSEAHFQVDALRRQLCEAENDLGTRLAEARPRLVAALGQMPEAAESEARVLAEAQQVDEQLKKQRQACQELLHRRSTAAARHQAAEAELRRAQAEESRLAAELGGGGHAEFLARITAQRELVENMRKDVAMTESAKHMYEKFREKSLTKNTCQFCRRGFNSEEDSARFEETVHKLIEKIPTYLEESHRRMGEAREELNRLEAHLPRWDRLEQLRQVDIPQKQKALATCAEEERATQAAAEPAERERRRLEDLVQQLQELRMVAGALQRSAAAAEELRGSVRAKEARLLGANSKVSLQAERDQLRTLQEQLNELGREEDAVRTQRELLGKQQEQLRTQLAEQKGRLQLLQAQVARQGDVDRELTNRQAELRSCSEAAQRARAVVEERSAAARVLRERHQEQSAAARRDLDARREQVVALQREADAASEMERSIDAMARRVADADALKAKLEASDAEVATAERELAGLRERLDGEEERRRKRDEVRQCLDANLRLKRLEAESGRHEAEAAELLRELGGKDLEALRGELVAARSRAMELQKQRSFHAGELAQTQEAVRSLAADLASPLYAGVEQRHREAIIKAETAVFTVRDMGRYHSALDKALMKYHSMKMEEINKTIRDLWQRVYRGRDIDNIAIRSDVDESDGQQGDVPDAGTAGRALKSYNYRVVMLCGDTELDMKGRCSAGQRVLASLIIRLALADSFCINCGVLALDEPTTNLDSRNITSLAEALAALIEARRRTKRFQLIIITHDDAFVDILSACKVSDWYYHIQKNDKGCSKVQKREMRLLAG